MDFKIVDTETAYRRLLDAPDAASRETIFCESLVKPFEGLAQVFGMGSDPLKAFRMWGMWPEFYAENRDRTATTLDKLAEADAWNRAAESLEVGRAAFAPYAEQMPLNEITFGLCLCDMGDVPGQHGYSGFGGVPGYIMTVYGDANDYNLPRIEACTVHELHHNIFFAVTKLNIMRATVGDYMILEGLAESFAAELYGEELTGYWVSEFDETRLAETKQKIHGALELTGFDTTRSYLFGDDITASQGRPTVGVPPFAGYAIGYRIVRAYLKRTGKRVADATFVSPREIIAESKYFD